VRRTSRIGKARTISRSPHSADPTPRRHTLVAAFGYALEGIVTAWRTQRNVRIHTVLAVLVVVAGIVLRFSATSWAIVTLAVALVLVAELVNTALEALVDLASPQDHPLAKQAKDVAAAAVLAAALGAAAAGIFVLVQTLAGR
jgi:undecaprenol kinase